MGLNKRTSVLTSSMLLMGLVAFLFCQAHPASGHEHEAPAGAEESCQISVLPSAVLSGAMTAGLDQPSGHGDGPLDLFPVLAVEKDLLNRPIGNADPPVYPYGTVKLYQFNCTYLL